MDVFVLGFAVHPPADRIRDKRLEELVFDTSAEALNRARTERQEIDHITLATCDELDGRSISSMLLAAPAGGYLKDEIKVTDSGLIGLCLAAMRIGTGRFNLGLMASWSKTSIAPFEDVMRMRCEPFFTRPIGLNASIADSLFAQALVSKGIASEDRANAVTVDLSNIAAKNQNGVRRKPPTVQEVTQSSYVGVPLRMAHQAPLTDGAVSIVLCSGKWLDARSTAKPLARIAGLGWAVDSYALSLDRLTALNSFRTSWNRALKQAAVRDAGSLDAIELDNQTAFHALAYEQALDLSGAPSVSPSGSAFAQNPYFCMGLINVVEAVRQLADLAGPLQIKQARRVAAHGQHGFAQQGNAVVVLERV
jgi:acetyl-CoA acetyltransferase